VCGANAERHRHFFGDDDVAHLVPVGVDLNTSATLFMGNLVVPFVLRGTTAGMWCPYVAAGLGVVRAEFEGNAMAPGGAGYDTKQDDLTPNIGRGIMYALTDWFGFRVDGRYFHALADDGARKGGYFEDYGFWRVSVGIGFGFPRRARCSRARSGAREHGAPVPRAGPL
jgi:hypothetical protein